MYLVLNQEQNSMDMVLCDYIASQQHATLCCTKAERNQQVVGSVLIE